MASILPLKLIHPLKLTLLEELKVQNHDSIEIEFNPSLQLQSQPVLLRGVRAAHGPQDPRGARVRLRACAGSRRLCQGSDHPQREARLLPGNWVSITDCIEENRVRRVEHAARLILAAEVAAYAA